MTKMTVYVVDDDASFADSINFMLDELGYRIVIHTDAARAIDVLKTIDLVHPACLLLDVRMPQMSGLQLHDHLLEAGVDLPIVYLTGHGDVALAVEAMEKGAFTFIEKPVNFAQLEEVLKAALSPSVQCRRQSSNSILLAAERERALQDLSPREAEVLNGIVEGYSARQIGELLFISAKTVDFHRARIMSKLKVRKVAELHRIMALAAVGKSGMEEEESASAQ